MALSLVCKDCGLQLKSVAEAQSHGYWRSLCYRTEQISMVVGHLVGYSCEWF